MADGRRVPIESLSPGDVVRSLSVPGLAVDTPFRVQYEWMSEWGLDGATMRDGRISSVRLGEHDGFYLVNRRIKATFEHPFLVRRDDTWGFCSTELLEVGDHLITANGEELAEEVIESVERIGGAVRTVAITVPETNTYLADGVWVHNDAESSGTIGQSGVSTGSSSFSLSGSAGSSSQSSSGSGSAKSSGSSVSGSASTTSSSGR